jgi:hypothetical protein
MKNEKRENNKSTEPQAYHFRQNKRAMLEHPPRKG